MLLKKYAENKNTGSFGRYKCLPQPIRTIQKKNAFYRVQESFTEEMDMCSCARKRQGEKGQDLSIVYNNGQIAMIWVICVADWFCLYKYLHIVTFVFKMKVSTFTKLSFVLYEVCVHVAGGIMRKYQIMSNCKELMNNATCWLIDKWLISD